MCKEGDNRLRGRQRGFRCLATTIGRLILFFKKKSQLKTGNTRKVYAEFVREISFHINKI